MFLRSPSSPEAKLFAALHGMTAVYDRQAFVARDAGRAPEIAAAPAIDEAGLANERAAH